MKAATIRDLYTPEENQRYLKRILGNMRQRTCENHNWFYDFVSLLEDIDGSLGEEIRGLEDIKKGSYDDYLLRIINAEGVGEKIRHYKEMSSHYSLDDEDDLREVMIGYVIQGAEKHAEEGKEGLIAGLVGMFFGTK